MSVHQELSAADSACALHSLWGYLRSWETNKGAINGPVVHRCDLKRLFKTHDTAWTQSAVIEGLITLYKRSQATYWLEHAQTLADTQCARQKPDGSYRWAGHEDDRFSSLVSNAYADCALLSLVEVLREQGRLEDSNKYLKVIGKNIDEYLFGQLYSDMLGGFRVNPVDYYQRRDNFVINMNSLAVEVLIRYDNVQGTKDYLNPAVSIGNKILAFQCTKGDAKGGFAYSHIEPHCFVTLYSALSLRGLCQLHLLTGEQIYREAVVMGTRFLDKMKHPSTGLWRHRLTEGKLDQYPLFVAGAGIIGNALLEASCITEEYFNPQPLASILLSYSLRNGGIRNFIGYDHPGNSRSWASKRQVWEDVFPTPNWNAHAFSFLCKVLEPPTPLDEKYTRTNFQAGRTFCYFENRSMALVLETWPPVRAMAALFVKQWKYALILPSIFMVWKWTKRVLQKQVTFN